MAIRLLFLGAFFLFLSDASLAKKECLEALKSALGSESGYDSFARAAGLKYKFPEGKGITRKKVNGEYVYVDARGKRVSKTDTERLNALQMPPNYKDVWFSPDPKSHIQAVGTDARGRKQYRYHPKWLEIRADYKYQRIREFGEHLSEIRKQSQKNLRQDSLTKERVTASVIRLLDKTAMRIGNEKYATENESFGLTTLLKEHVSIRDKQIKFSFRGKSGVDHVVVVEEATLAASFKDLVKLEGDHFFQYRDDAGVVRELTSSDVNEALSVYGDFTAKDFRTWVGTVTVVDSLMRAGPPDSPSAAKEHIRTAVEAAAEKLGNTPSICLKNYVAPAVIQAYTDGSFFKLHRRGADAEALTLRLLEP